jgi:hypothetical protein
MLLICGFQMFINCWHFQILKHKISLLEASNAELQRELQERKVTSEHLTQRALDAQVLFKIFSLVVIRCHAFLIIFPTLIKIKLFYLTYIKYDQVEKDQLAMKIESARNGKSWDEIDSSSNQV